MTDPKYVNPYDLGDVATNLRGIVAERARMAGPLAKEASRLRQECTELKAQRDELLPACEGWHQYLCEKAGEWDRLLTPREEGLWFAMKTAIAKAKGE